MVVEGVQVFQLGIQAQFAQLTDREKRYAHHMSRAAWHGARIILRQVSPESLAIFDFINELHRECSGEWESLIGPEMSKECLQSFLIFSATFLSNIGNYYGFGDQKFVPGVHLDVLKYLSKKSSTLECLFERFADSINSRPPFSLGYPSETAQSSYYPGAFMSETEIAAVSRALEKNVIFPENTRIQVSEDGKCFEVLVASVQSTEIGRYALTGDDRTVKVTGGDHADDLMLVCTELEKAVAYVANDYQKDLLNNYIDSFQTGSLDSYRKSQEIWVKDKGPRVENIFGFVEPYRDPHGIRAEFEGLVAIADDEETALLNKLVENSSAFIERLPWVMPELSGNGPFEKNLFEAPDFSSIHTLAYCSSMIFPGINLPNYNDIRQEHGFKNVIVANRMAAESQAMQYPFIDESEAEQFKKHKFPAYYWWVVLHELLGHGTGRMLMETTNGTLNFDIDNRPINPITGNPIESWYKLGQTWTGQFGDLATTVDECRAELVGAYLMDEPDLLALLGFTESSEISAQDLTYNLYQQLGVDGLRGLANFNVDTGKWSQAHSRAHFAMLRCLLHEGGGVVSIAHDKADQRLTVRVDRSKIQSHGKVALGKMLLNLHIFRCTADVDGCRTYYEGLSKVEPVHLEWRDTVIVNKPPPLIFTHANTFMKGEDVVLKEYEATIQGIIQSWAERCV